jgi:uncharacterized protein (DUF885 family)
MSFYGDLKVPDSGCAAALFSETPQAEFAIPPRREFRETTAPALSYQRAAADGRSTAILYVKYGAIAAEPATVASGRAVSARGGARASFSTAIQQERADLPRFRRFGGDARVRRRLGLYAASLGEELGFVPGY